MNNTNNQFNEIIIISGNIEKNLEDIIEQSFKEEVKKEYNYKLSLIQK